MESPLSLKSFIHKKKKKYLCMNCEDWIEEHMPDVSFESIYLEKLDDTEMAQEMQDTVSTHRPSKATKDTPFGGCRSQELRLHRGPEL